MKPNIIKMCDIAIHSVSQAAIKALRSYVIDSKMIWECLNKLNEVGKKNKVYLIWVLGHSGIKGNEEANTFAKEGARTSLIGPELLCGIGKCTYKKEVLEKKNTRKANSGGISQGLIIPLSSFGTLKQQDPDDIWILGRNNDTSSLAFL